MLLTNANDIISKSYTKLGDLALQRARNMKNGYSRSESQKKLYTQSRMIELNLGCLVNNLSLDDEGKIIRTLRTTDEQVNRFLKVLQTVAEIDEHATSPVLLSFPKKRYILTIPQSQEQSESVELPVGLWVAQGNWNGSFNTFPVLGREGDSVKEGYTWEVSVATTTLYGPDGGPIPAGATIRALTDAPGQTLANWRIHYA